jgi:site-specific DNA-cytosine methylase
MSLLHSTFFFRSQESSSVKTFKAVLQCLESIDISWFILENVDLEIGPDSNYSIIMRSCEEVGPKYAVMAYKMLSSDFGLPQRRTRLYIVGVSRKAYPTFDMKAIAKLLDILKLPTQKPVACQVL